MKLKLGLHVLFVSFSKLRRISSSIIHYSFPLTHASHTQSLFRQLPNLRRKQEIGITRELGRTWHAFILQSPHRMTLSDPAEGEKKNLHPIAEGSCSHLRTGQSPTRSQQPKHHGREIE